MYQMRSGDETKYNSLQLTNFKKACREGKPVSSMHNLDVSVST